MSQSPNRLISFWQELKRRKTGKVIIAYAATAFILLQLADILSPALLLPEWTTRLITLILIIGFPLAIVFSWVFDFTSEGIKKTMSTKVSEVKSIASKPSKRILTVSNIIIAVLIIAVAILAYPKIFRKDTLEKLKSSGERIAVAVMPFQNMTNDAKWDVWQDGIQMNLITYLSNDPEELQVRQLQSVADILHSKGIVSYASLNPSVARTISKKLDTDVFINGSINQSESTIRLNAQLISSNTEDLLKSFQIDGKSENILPLIDSLSIIVRDFLLIFKLRKELPTDYQRSKFVNITNSPEAFKYYVYGQNAFLKTDFPAAAKFLSQAIDVDSNFYNAAAALTFSYYHQQMYKEAKDLCLRLYNKREQMPMERQIDIDFLYACLYETPSEAIKYLMQKREIDDQSPGNYLNTGVCYFQLYQFDKAISELEKALEIYDKWDSKPLWIFNYLPLGLAYHRTGQYEKERKLYKRAEQDFPNDRLLLMSQSILSLTVGDTVLANKYIKEYVSILKSRSSSEAGIYLSLANIYSEAGILDIAEKYFRLAFLSEPQNPMLMNSFAYFLIDKDRNLNEGLELADKALTISPDNSSIIDTKGWGLYKQGKYQEALKLIEKAWDLKPLYDHELYLHLEAAKKAVANLKID